MVSSGRTTADPISRDRVISSITATTTETFIDDGDSLGSFSSSQKSGYSRIRLIHSSCSTRHTDSESAAIFGFRKRSRASASERMSRMPTLRQFVARDIDSSLNILGTGTRALKKKQQSQSVSGSSVSFYTFHSLTRSHDEVSVAVSAVNCLHAS